MNRNTDTNKLIALWALSESGLGGMMHALKIPFTGFFLGGFAVVIICLIAHFSATPLRSILRATLLVVLVKAAASPHSPPMAYIAVGFQGLSGALLFGGIPWFRFTCILFGFLALLESAVQKVLVTTLIFGKSIWEALDKFFEGILKDLHLSSDISFSLWLIGAYTGGYALWGIIIGSWAGGLPARIQKRKDEIIMAEETASLVPVKETLRKKRSAKWIGALLMLAFIVVVFLTGSGENGAGKALYAIVRTIAALLLIYYLLTPVIKFILAGIFRKRAGRYKNSLNALMETIPEFRTKVPLAYSIASASHRGLVRYREFVFVLIVLSLYTTKIEQ